MKERRKIVFCFVCVLFSLILNACSVIKEKDVNTFETTSKLNTKGIEKNNSKSAREDFEREDKYWKFLLSEIAISATKDNKDYYKSSPVFWFKLCKTAGLLREEEVEYSYIYYVSKKDLDEYFENVVGRKVKDEFLELAYNESKNEYKFPSGIESDSYKFYSTEIIGFKRIEDEEYEINGKFKEYNIQSNEKVLNELPFKGVIKKSKIKRFSRFYLDTIEIDYSNYIDNYTNQVEKTETNETKQVKSSEEAFSPNEEKLLRLALNHYERHNNYRPRNVSIEENGDGTVSIHLYNDEVTHTATLDWYTINKETLKGTNFMEENIDLMN